MTSTCLVVPASGFVVGKNLDDRGEKKPFMVVNTCMGR